MYLLDTNVVSELRRPHPNRNIVQWVADTPGEQFLSVIVIGELTRGVELLRRRRAPQTQAYAEWLDALVHDFSRNILPIGAAIAAVWGRLDAQRPLPTGDGLIAATALVHDLTLVTRTTRDFDGTGVRLLNPFAG